MKQGDAGVTVTRSKKVSKVSKDLLKVSNVCQWHIVYRPPNNAYSFNHEAAAMSDLGRLVEYTAVVLEYCE